MKVAIIGCGLIGKKRASALEKFREDELKIVCDIDKDKADLFAKKYNCESTNDWREIIKLQDIDIVINSTINSMLETITVHALNNKKNVLCEKPLGRNTVEAMNMVNAAERNKMLLKTGFNHCFHPNVWKAKEYFDTGKIGKLMTIRANYGHGSRPGMEKEWRSSREICGGGELLDQGVHIIDLIRWFGGEIKQVFGRIETKYWKIDVEDNAFVIFKTKNNVDGIFNVSWTNWKNNFIFEAFGTEGYLKIEGLGGSYGPEILECGIKKHEGGRPKIEVYNFDKNDISWEKEWKEFRDAIIENRQPLKNGLDGLKANQVVEAIYKSSKEDAVIYLNTNNA